MSNEICRVCGAGLERHGTMDHNFEPLSIESPSREMAMTLDEYKLVYAEGIENIKNMTPEQVVEHIAHLEKTIVKMRVLKYSAAMRLVDIERDLSEEQKKVLREKSASYKVKVSASESKPKERAAGKSVEQKAVESIAKLLGMSEEEAKAYIDRERGGK